MEFLKSLNEMFGWQPVIRISKAEAKLLLEGNPRYAEDAMKEAYLHGTTFAQIYQGKFERVKFNRVFTDKCIEFSEDNEPKPEFLGVANLRVDFVLDIENKFKRDSVEIKHPLFNSETVAMRARQCGKTRMNRKWFENYIEERKLMLESETKVCEVLNRWKGI